MKPPQIADMAEIAGKVPIIALGENFMKVRGKQRNLVGKRFYLWGTIN